MTPAIRVAGPCPFPVEGAPCEALLEYRGLIAAAFGPGGNELYRWDCPNGHTILGEYTHMMGDEPDPDAACSDCGQPRADHKTDPTPEDCAWNP